MPTYRFDLSDFERQPHPLGDGLILSNLRRLRYTSTLRSEEGSTDRFGALAWEFIARRVFAISRETWSIDKVRELFGSRVGPKGPPQFRWEQILILAEALEATVLDLTLPHTDHEGCEQECGMGERDSLTEYASALLGLPVEWLPVKKRNLLQWARIREMLLEQALNKHPQMQDIMGEWDKEPDVLAVEEAYSAMLDSRLSLLSLKAKDAKSGLLDALVTALVEPPWRVGRSPGGGRVSRYGGPPHMAEEEALPILRELGLLGEAAKGKPGETGRRN